MQHAPLEEPKKQEDNDIDTTMEAPAPAPVPEPKVDQQSDSNSVESPDIVPDSSSIAAAQPTQRSSVTWAALDQELAQRKIEDQRKLLKKQNRCIKFLKNEVGLLKRKLHEMQQNAQGMNPDIMQQHQHQHHQEQQPFQHQQDNHNNNNNNNDYPQMDRRTSAGEDHPPGKKMRIMDDGSASASFQSCSVDNSQEEPIPLQVEPAPTATRVYLTKEEEHEQTPNTFKVRNQPIVDPYGDRGTFSGSISSSSALPHGRGRMLYEDGQRIYKGGWNNGQWHGVGEAIFANGDRYNGDYHLDQRHGHGRYGWSDGRVYEGEFKADKRHGKGAFYWPDGAKYEGDFNNGFREGHGTYIFSGGCKYNGEWKDGRYNGVGCCMWTNGRCYSGEWKDGMRHGKGVETEEDGAIRHDGQWCKDQPVTEINDTEQPQKATPKRRASTNKEAAGRSQGWFRKSNREATSKH